MQKGWLSFILGFWLIVSAFIQTMHIPENMIIVGLLITIDGIFMLKKWDGLFLGIFGFWIMLSGFLFELATTWNFLTMGILVTFISFICIFHRRELHRATH
jgi:hypothetical protein